MNRRELLREMSRVQATWVNRNTPGTGDVDIAVEDEQEYLTKIAAVFERAREDVRRKRGRGVTAAGATAVISALLLAYDPGQKRDPDGKWGDGIPGTPALSRKDDPLSLSGRVRLGPGETLRGSDRVRTNSGGDGDSLLAALSGPDGPQVRFAVIPSADARSWSADNKGATARFEGAEDVGRVASGLASVADEAKRVRENIRATGTQLDREGVWEGDDADLTPDQAARRAAYESLDDDTTISSGVIPGSGWGDIHWSVQGDNIGDPGEEDVLVSVLVRPPDERDMSWDEMRDSVTGSWFPALYDVSGTARLVRSAEKMASASQSAVTAAAFRFDPDQPRDRQGQWADSPGGSLPTGGRSAFGDWTSQSTDTAELDTPRLMELGDRIGQVMRRDGTNASDPGALYDAATEALAGSGIAPRQYVNALDQKYGTSLAPRVADALQARGDAPASPEVVPTEIPDTDVSEQPGPDTSVRDFPALSVADTNEAWDAIEGGWSADQSKALQTYTSMAYSSINRAMWEGRGDRGPYADTIRDVRSAMAPSPVSQTTYRRTSGKSFGLPEFASTDELRGLVGTSVQNPGFTSTTVDESVLQDHPSVVHMQIEVPRGTPSAWVHNVGLDHDGELLLDANTRYEVLSVEPMGSFETLMRVRIVP